VERALGELKERLGEIADLERARNVLEWDLNVWMPPGGEGARASQLATLESVIHGRRIDDRIGELLADLIPDAHTLPPDSEDACLVRVAQRDWERKRRIPTSLAAELARVEAEAFTVWVRARDESDFELFRPLLERTLELKLRWIECFAPYDDPYDMLLDEYDEGLCTADLERIFGTLAPELTALVDEHAGADDARLPAGRYPVTTQDALSRELVEAFGGRWDEFRLDVVPHPFQITFGPHDIRLTTAYSERNLHSLFSAMHEFGHGAYEWGSSPNLDRTPLAGGASATIHESQSRLWENAVGRSLPFWRWFYPRVQDAFPDCLRSIPLADFYSSVNRARRTLIRFDADETSYGLHIILRYELERQMVTGRLAIADLPEAWNSRFQELLGIEVPDDRRGVLQDTHWAVGLFGYFPTYLLGSVLSIQIWERARAALPELDTQIERGDFSRLHAWLRENLYALGSTLTPADTIERVVGGPIDPQPYLRYLREKLDSVAR
jgi:carboxypeptidase Taq